jgi:hypothetical protein
MRPGCVIPTALGVSLSLVALASSSGASAAEAGREQAPGGAASSLVKHAPAGPPLSSPASPGESTDSGLLSSASDPLVENGLSSPMCEGAWSTDLSAAADSNCQTSGFVGAPAPTGNYGIDVHIDVGPLGLSKGGLLSVIQDMFVTPVWSALVWAVHALDVMLEWCYALELLGGSTLDEVTRSLRQAQTSFTGPWLAFVLAVASVLALYNGLVRRRVTETLGQALTALAMMACGLWMIADPLGSIGAVGRWANQASLGTLGATARGTPSKASQTLADSTRGLFTSAIEMPWCYLEFGNVRWCSDPAQLDPRLHKAGLQIEARQKAMIGCEPSAVALFCASPGSPGALAVERSDRLMSQATTNGGVFLAFPANGPERNAITEDGSLLRVLCQAPDDTRCTGPTASEAEFRSDGGTVPRAIGVLLIALGVLGMVALLGLVALHLLAAAVLSLFMLLLAPFAVLAPALGDGGRAIFSGWATRLLAAVASKLLFSFLLGALLTMQRMLTSFQSLGWWTEWLLISAFWWTVFFKRHQALALLQGRGRATVAHSPPHASGGIGPRPGASRARARRGGSKRTGRRLDRSLPIAHPVRWAWDKLHSPAPPDELLPKPGSPGRGGRGSPQGRRRHTPKQERTLRTRVGQGGLPSNAPSPVAAARADGGPSNSSPPVPTVSAAVEPSSGPDRSDTAVDADGARARAPERKSRIMDDARAVAEGRKRQLGYEPPP